MKSLIISQISACCIGILLLTVSCEKYLQVDPPNDMIATNSVFTDSLTADIALSGIYNDMMFSSTGLLAAQNRWAGLYADELVYSQTSDIILQFLDGNLQADNSNLNTLWVDLYKHIYQTNSLIEGVTNSKGISKLAKERLIGEAKFLRAFLFFYTVNNWGAIPLTLTTDYRENAIMPRFSEDAVYKQIISDLKDAYDVLRSEYIAQDRVRANKYTAASLLSKVYLYLEQWEDAEKYADEVIESNVYELTDLNKVFLIGSEEIIFQMFPSTLSPYYNSYDGYYFVSSLSSGVLPMYYLKEPLINSFESNDQRLSDWMGSMTVDGTTYRFPYKYKVGFDPNRAEYQLIFRLGELYLIRSEARSQLNRLSGAVQDLNIVRNRAGLGLLSTDLARDEIMSAIETERRHELFCEWGNRWYDLKRTGRMTNRLWPIPLNQLLSNPKLTQNVGY